MNRECFSVKSFLALILLSSSLKLSLAQEGNACASPDPDTYNICYLIRNAEIRTQNSVIVYFYNNELVEDLRISENKMILYLPVRVAETFPNLIRYFSDSCSLTTISKVNFENLGALKLLSLQDNQIQMITSGTFEDLTSLETLQLSQNQIKFVDIDAFVKLVNLQFLRMEENVCVNGNFEGEYLLSIRGFGIDQCAYKENIDGDLAPAISVQLYPLNSEDLKTIISYLEKLLKQAYDEATEIKMQRAENVAKISSLERRLSESESARDQCLSRVNEMYQIEVEQEELDETVAEAEQKAREAEEKAEEVADKTAKYHQDLYEILRDFKIEV